MSQLVRAVPRRLEEAIAGARHWSDAMPREASKLVRTIRNYNGASAIVSGITGLTAWAVISQSSEIVAQVVVTLVSFLAAVLVALPTALGMRERCEKMLTLCGDFTAAYDELLAARDGWVAGTAPPQQVGEAIRKFDGVNVKKAELGM
ncbi:hypothetical protein OG883_31150 [Streptomyces sp. NBC_01142]|uniref:hypothetical protein n=1 Tax=Streptomyces sp. NBC_01142 TaxID=2975865 RepID=UPI00225A0484|nr:hypothetical protein [Streptomyces sp. NBC_01142]MCX4824237.1 hypothetical protein [Streptomyces sp. NBC_01142]